MKKILAVILAACLLFTTGCAGTDFLSEAIEDAVADIAEYVANSFDEGTGNALGEFAGASGAYFEDIPRQETDFYQMEYVHYNEEDFLAICDEMYAIAEQGAEISEAVETLDRLFEELYFIYTLSELATIEYYSDPTDPYWEAEANYSSELSFKLYDEFMYAVGAVAISEHSELLESRFYTEDIEYLGSTYGERMPESESQTALDMYANENELINSYYSLMNEEEPDKEAVAELFVELVESRRQEAEWYGYDSYAEYAYDYFYCKDYYPEDAQAIWDGVKEYFSPVSEEYYWEMDRIESLLERRDDLDCSPEAILAAMERNMPRVSEELSEAFDYMKRNHLYNIDYSEQKAAMGYTTRLYYYDVPFIFNAPYGEFTDYLDMIHEFGHFSNMFYTQTDLLFGISDIDLGELQSQGLEMLFTAFYDDIFGVYADDVEEYLLMDIVCVIVEGAMYDEFQQRVFMEENLSAERVCEIFAEVYEEYGYEPYEEYEYEWIYVPHNFDFPFYYISYAVSALGALEIYTLMQTDFDAAADKYLYVCSMNTEYYYYSEALEEADFADIFDIRSFAETAQTVIARLD